MDYAKLGTDLVKLEQTEERREEDSVAGKPAAEAVKSELSNMTEGQRRCSAAMSGILRRAVCKGIEKTARDLIGWDLQGYTERVDSDPIVCDSFQVVTEKRLPRVLITSPEVIVATGLASHIQATREDNRKKKIAENPVYNTDAATENAVLVDEEPTDPDYVDVAEYPIDIEVHEKRPTINPDDFYLRNQDGEQVEQPRSILSMITKGRKRNRPPPTDEEKKDVVKRQRKRRKLEVDMANSEFISLMEPEQ